MRVNDPGHSYELQRLDGEGCERLIFVKRNDPPEKFPGNINSYTGTILQEVFRAAIDRLKYVDNQIAHPVNDLVIRNCRDSIRLLEIRAAQRHGREIHTFREDIENEPTCPTCGHIQHECADAQRKG